MLFDMKHYQMPEHDVWRNMIHRCHNKKDSAYKNYGGRGIFVCERWRNSFQSFLEDMGPRPPGYSVERINNNGPYAPENCKWATRAEQSRNRRNNVWIVAGGKKQVITDWANQIGENVETISLRMREYGWTPAQAVNQEQRINPLSNMLTYKGETLPTKDMAAKYGIDPEVLRGRLMRGIPVAVALTKPVSETRGGQASDKPVTVDGETNTLKYFCVKYGQPSPRVYARVTLGWTTRQALGLDPKPKRKAWNAGGKGVKMGEAKKNSPMHQKITIGGVEMDLYAASKVCNLEKGVVLARLNLGWTVQEALGIIARDNRRTRHAAQVTALTA